MRGGDITVIDRDNNIYIYDFFLIGIVGSFPLRVKCN